MPAWLIYLRLLITLHTLRTRTVRAHRNAMQHVERRHFYLRELVEEHVIRVPFV